MSWLESLKQHHREYLMEAALLGTFMVSACAFVGLLYHPDSPVRLFVTNPFLQQALTGIAMGLTAVLLIYSPWGQQSGAHMNPSVTLTFYRLGKITANDAAFYMLAQFAGGVLGVAFCVLALGGIVQSPSVNYVATVPGPRGSGIAFAAEAVISFLMMSMVLQTSNRPRLTAYTGYLAGLLVALFITFEAPLSGMSMNPARTLGSALPGRIWTSLWIYFTAPPLGMLAAAELYVRRRGIRRVLCAKFAHRNNKRCIFRCNFGEIDAPESAQPQP